MGWEGGRHKVFGECRRAGNTDCIIDGSQLAVGQLNTEWVKGGERKITLRVWGQK